MSNLSGLVEQRLHGGETCRGARGGGRPPLNTGKSRGLKTGKRRIRSGGVPGVGRAGTVRREAEEGGGARGEGEDHGQRAAERQEEAGGWGCDEPRCGWNLSLEVLGLSRRVLCFKMVS